MKPANYYELLGVAPHVGSGQIQAAYRFARSLYIGDATPTYGLLEADDRVRMLALVEEAYAVLSNPSTRREYEISLAGQGPARSQLPVAGRSPERVGDRRAAEVSPPPSSPEPPVEVVRVPDFVNGMALRAMREARSLSVDQISALSKIGTRFLKALEDDRHDILPGRVFARGFLIEYARAVRASELELADRYLRNWTGK